MKRKVFSALNIFALSVVFALSVILPGLSAFFQGSAPIPLEAQLPTSVVTPSTPSSGAETSVPDAARGPAIPPDKGYLVQQIRDNLYWVSNGIFQTMFLTYDNGVIVVDAPESIGKNYLNAIREVTDKPVTYVIYSHSHTDHIGAASTFPNNATYIAQKETAAILERRKDPRRPIPTVTFSDTYTLNAGDQTLVLDYRGVNHEPGNIFIYAPRQKVLMLVDIVYPGWVPFKNLGLADDVPGYIKAHDIALAYDFDTFIGGHVNRLGTRQDVMVSREFVLDLEAAAAQALQQVNFSDFAQQIGYKDVWKLYNAYSNAFTQKCTDMMMPKWKDRLGGADTYLSDDCWEMAESLTVQFPPVQTPPATEN